MTEKKISIPTYEVLAPDPNPVFFNGRRYQGASGKVYPYPLIDNLSENKIDKEYTGLIIENEYIEVCVLPELGGKFYYAKDKTNGYYFIYHNRVIKPSLIGMAGAWTSGGVEWNIPHHHRASTFLPVDYKITSNSDGSKTVWVGETELRHRLKWIAGLTLYPGKSFVEATVKVFNTTPVTNSILVWANAATHTNENYQVIFPPLTQYATFHKKNQFTEWPVSRQVYTGADFTKGVDVSWWKNHSISTSFFAWEPRGNFVAGYDHGKKAGTVIFGNRHLNPGMKLWSWGNNEHGILWNKFLTDNDGEYVELMYGAFSDNQPDYSWIHPYETKETKMYFMPSKNISSVKETNLHGFVNLDITEKGAEIGVYSSEKLKGVKIILLNKGTIQFTGLADVDPAIPFTTSVKLKKETVPADLTLYVISNSGDTLFNYAVQNKPNNPVPKTVKTPVTPDKLSTADSLYYAGLRLEQFHEPQLNPLDYYQQALKLDPEHVKANLRLGINYYSRGMYDKAEKYLKKATDRITWDYTVAEDGEALYYLGLAKLRSGKEKEGYELLYKSAWDYEWSAPAHYQMALIKLRQRAFDQALEHLNKSLSTHAENIDALCTKLTLLRHLNRTAEASQLLQTIFPVDPVNLRAIYEKQLLGKNKLGQEQVKDIAASGVQTILEQVVKYGSEGFYVEANDLLNYCIFSGQPSLSNYPEVYYLSAYYHHLMGKKEEVSKFLSRASALPADYYFPFRTEALEALQFAVTQNSNDAKAYLYIGNLYYDNQPGKAIEAWEKAAALNKQLPVVNRNLAFAYANHQKEYDKAVQQIKEAISKNPSDPRYFYEQDLYLELKAAPLTERLAALEQNETVVLSANSGRSTYAVLLVLSEKYDKALEIMKKHRFRIWEGEASPYDYWLYAHTILAAKAMNEGKNDIAGKHLKEALSKPGNIDVPLSKVEKIVYYFEGLLAMNQGNSKLAKEKLAEAVKGETDEGDIKFFAGLAYQQSGNTEKAKLQFDALIENGNKMLGEKGGADFFNPFAKKTSGNEHQAKAYYWMALGHKGKGDTNKAAEYYQKAKQRDPALMGFAFKTQFPGDIKK